MSLLNLLKGAQQAPDAATAVRALTTFLGATGEEGVNALRRAGLLPLTPRQAATESAGIFKPGTRPAVTQGPAQRVNLAPVQRAATPPVRRPEPPVAGIFQTPAQPAVRSAARPVRQAASATPPSSVAPPAPAASAPAAPQAAENFVPLEGRQMDLFSGFNRLRYPAGTTTAEGFKVGGLTYNPADIPGERQGTEFIRGLQTRGGKPFLASSGIDEDLLLQESLKQTMRPGASVADELYGSAIPRGTGLMSGPIDFGVYQARNLLKNNLGNIAELVRNNPALAAGLGTTGLTALGITGYNLLTNDAAPETQTPRTLGPVSESVDAGGLINDPQAKQERQQEAVRRLAVEMDAAARAVIPPAQYRGADGQTVITTRGRNEALTAAKQQYTKPQKALRDYYSGREAYAQFPANKAEIVSELTKRNILDTPELQTWARSNPTLAYELLRKATGSNVLPSQQMPQQTTMVIGSQMGDDLVKNAAGNAAYAAEAADKSAGASDIEDATRFIPRPKVNYVPLGGRFIPSGGSIPSVPFA